MYVVTNRELLEGRQGLAVFGDRPSAAGPNELRLLGISRSRSGWRVNVLADELDAVHDPSRQLRCHL